MYFLFLAIFFWDIPWNLGLMYGRYLQWIGSEMAIDNMFVEYEHKQLFEAYASECFWGKMLRTIKNYVEVCHVSQA